MEKEEEKFRRFVVDRWSSSSLPRNECLRLIVSDAGPPWLVNLIIHQFYCREIKKKGEGNEQRNKIELLESAISGLFWFCSSSFSSSFSLLPPGEVWSVISEGQVPPPPPPSPRIRRIKGGKEEKRILSRALQNKSKNGNNTDSDIEQITN